MEISFFSSEITLSIRTGIEIKSRLIRTLSGVDSTIVHCEIAASPWKPTAAP